MGGSSSKAARSAAGSAARKYPTRTSTQPPTAASRPSALSRPRAAAEGAAGPTVRPMPEAASTKSEAIDLDARDPDFANRLSQLGPVKPAPTFSNSSTVKAPPSAAAQNESNAPGASAYPSVTASPAIAVVAARQRMQDAADQERIDHGRKGFLGKEFVDITTVKRALTMRDERGMDPSAIEQTLGLKQGVVARLGRVGVVEVV